MTDEVQKQAEISAVLNLIPYLDTYFIEKESEEKITLDYIVRHYRNDPGVSKTDAFQVLKSAIENDESGKLKNIELVDQSRTHADLKEDLTQGCTFRDPEGNYYVAFRGTGYGRWPDNGDGMTELSTEMQEASRKYFDEVAKKYLIDAKKDGAEVFITGHSKGGNEAQYVYMTSEYEDLIDKCYNFDGQGFSGEARAAFEEKYGSRYDEKLDNMYSICGENDFVHDLGYVIIPEENTYFVETSGDGFDNLHMLENMIGDKDGNYHGLPFEIGKDGEVLNGHQGPVGEFAKKLSQNMMMLPEEDLHGTALAVMALIDKAYDNLWEYLDPENNDGIAGSLKVGWSDMLDLAANGVPAVFQTILFTEEGHELLGYLVSRRLLKSYKERGVGGVLGDIGVGYMGLTFLTTSVLPWMVPLTIDVQMLLKSADIIVDAANGIASFGREASRFISSTREAFLNTIDRFFSGGTAKKSYSPAAYMSDEIRVNTKFLNSYAERLEAVNQRLSSLDARLNSLYWRVGLVGLAQLLSADFRIAYSWKLEQCRAYLEETAVGFEEAEKSIENRVFIKG